jgi:hypothetical protein
LLRIRDGFFPTWFAAACWSASACAPSLMKLPAGPGASASDARQVITEATSTCRGVRTFSAEVGTSGSVGGQGLRGRLLVGLSAPASARIEAVAPFGQPVFIFVARDADATLLLPRDDRVLEHGEPAAVVESLAGVPLDAAGLRATLTGCASVKSPETGRSIGDDWRVVPEGADEIYFKRERSSSAWQLVAVVHAGGSDRNGVAWRAEYRDFQSGLPRSVRLVSRDPSRFDLRFALSQVEVNVTLGAEVFRVDVPRTARPITLQELRDARPGLRQD